MTDQTNVRAFISYAWSSEAHKDWVRGLAERLVGDGVDVVLDQWELRPGHDKFAFMERIVSDPEVRKVVIICDNAYVAKATARAGGVGTETQIISPELYEKASDQSRFVVVSREVDEHGELCRPAYYKSRLCIAMTDNASFEFQYEELIRWIYDRPLRKRPELGEAPLALLDEKAEAAKASRAAESFIATLGRTGPSSVSPQAALDASFEELQKFEPIDRVQGIHLDDAIWEAIDSMLPLSNRITEVFKADAKAGRSIDDFQHYLRFLERAAALTIDHDGWRGQTNWSLDHQAFFCEELFARLVAVSLSEERFDLSKLLMTNRYVVRAVRAHDGPKSQGYDVFAGYPESFTGRNQRLALRRLSLKSDLLRQRNSRSPVQFEEYQQADFVLYLNAIFLHGDLVSSKRWWPSSLLYATHYYGPLPMFVRAESRAYAAKVASIFGLKGAEELKAKIGEVPLDKEHIPQWEFDRIDLRGLSNHSNLGAFA